MSVSLYGSGQTVLQVVQGTSSTQVFTSSTSYVTTGLSASITPQSTTSKILILVSGSLYGAAVATVYRNSTDVAASASYGLMYTNITYVDSTAATYLDSPATTSATTYTVYLKAVSGTAYWNINPVLSTITLLEISGS
jgi:hypothetical protein